MVRRRRRRARWATYLGTVGGQHSGTLTDADTPPAAAVSSHQTVTTSQGPTEPRSATHADEEGPPIKITSRTQLGRIALALLLGVSIGVLTSLLQRYLDFPWLALVNAASPWLTTAFVAGALQARLPTAVLVGAAATLLQVVGYYVTADLRGFGVSTTYVLVWSLCAVFGGPVFGAAGHVWWRATPVGLGGALLVATYASEALVTYHVRLGDTATAWFFGAIALVLAMGLGWHRTQYPALGRWLVPAFIAGVAGHAFLGLVL
jgi:hypothetical protein